MFEVHEYTKPIIITSEKDFFDVFQKNPLIRDMISGEWELMLPRVQLEFSNVGVDSNPVAGIQFFLEGWWRNRADGVLGYYAKVNLQTGMTKAFRELPGDIRVEGARNYEAEANCLQECLYLMRNCVPCDGVREELELQWNKAAPKALREYANTKQEKDLMHEYLLPLESLTCWDWEKMRDLLLKRYDTTVEDIQNRMERRENNSDVFSTPKFRNSAEEIGMRFWRDEHDG